MALPASSDRIARTADDAPEFLSSHRAHSAATREFSRLAGACVDAARQIANRRGDESPTVRLAPDRCIVQLGPVAMTITHLRNATDLQAGGQLLAIIWQGVIAARGDHIPERLGARMVPAPPVALWEETYRATAQSEATWQWHPQGIVDAGMTSAELAVRCCDALLEALHGQPAPAPVDADAAGLNPGNA